MSLSAPRTLNKGWMLLPRKSQRSCLLHLLGTTRVHSRKLLTSSGVLHKGRETRINVGLYNAPGFSSFLYQPLKPRRFGTSKCSKLMSKKGHGDKIVEEVQGSGKAESNYTHYKDKIKSIWKKYGKVAAFNWFGTYFLTLGGFYVGFDQGFLAPSSWIDSDTDGGPVAVLTYFEQYQILETYIVKLKKNQKARTFLLAWFATKLTEPFRMAFVAASTPGIARWIGYRAARG